MMHKKRVKLLRDVGNSKAGAERVFSVATAERMVKYGSGEIVGDAKSEDTSGIVPPESAGEGSD